MSDFQDADDFFLEKSKSDPERWEELESQFPTLTKHDYHRAAIGEPISRKRKREGPKGDYVPKSRRRRLNDDDWEDSRRAKAKYLREWEEDFKYAKELADEGM